MENLLRVDFVNHHTLPSCNVVSHRVNHKTFEIDDINRVLQVRAGINNGMSKYQNPHAKQVSIVDYDGFLTSTPEYFKHSKKRCDVILHTTTDASHFLLNELKDRIPKTKVLTDATAQMLATLNELYTVPSIVNFIATFATKKCCYCNRQSTAPASIKATTAFNRVSTLAPHGFLLANTDIQNFGFELWEYSGNQTILLS